MIYTPHWCGCQSAVWMQSDLGKRHGRVFGQGNAPAKIGFCFDYKLIKLVSMGTSKNQLHQAGQTGKQMQQSELQELNLTLFIPFGEPRPYTVTQLTPRDLRGAWWVSSPFGHGTKPLVPCWDRCTTHFRTYFSGDWDVHWGLTGLLTHGHLSSFRQALRSPTAKL